MFGIAYNKKKEKSSMKILCSNFGLYKKGGWGRTFMLARGLVKLGHDVTIITNSGKNGLFFESIMIEGIKVICFHDILPLKIIKLGFGWFSIANRMFFSLVSPFDIVHADSHRPNAYYPCLINRLFHGSHFIIEWWDDFGSNGQLRNKNKLFKIFLGAWEKKTELSSKKNADGVIVLSEFMYQRAIKLGLLKNKLTIINGGADTDFIKYLPVNEKKEKLNIDKETKTFGFIDSGDSDLTNLMPFVFAIRKLNNKFKVKFINYGNQISKEKINKYNLKEIVINAGWLDYYRGDASLLAAVDVFVLIKKNNTINKSGWPNKIGDYFATGRPILANLYGDIEKLYKNHNLGIIPVNYDENDIYEKMNDICQGKYDLKRMGEINRKFAEKCISWDRKARDLYDFYRKIKFGSRLNQHFSGKDSKTV